MAIMFVGACLLTGAYGPNAQVFLSVFCFSLFFYGALRRCRPAAAIANMQTCAEFSCTLPQ